MLLLRNGAFILVVVLMATAKPCVTAAKTEPLNCASLYQGEQSLLTVEGPGGWYYQTAFLKLLYARKTLLVGSDSHQSRPEYRVAMAHVQRALTILRKVLGGRIANRIAGWPVCAGPTSAGYAVSAYARIREAAVALTAPYNDASVARPMAEAFRETSAAAAASKTFSLDRQEASALSLSPMPLPLLRGAKSTHCRGGYCFGGAPNDEAGAIISGQPWIPSLTLAQVANVAVIPLAFAPAQGRQILSKVIMSQATGKAWHVLEAALISTRAWNASSAIYISTWSPRAVGRVALKREAMVYRSVNGYFGSLAAIATWDPSNGATTVDYLDDLGNHTFVVDKNGRVLSGQNAFAAFNKALTPARGRAQ